MFDKNSKRFLQVDDFPIQDVMPHNQHRNSLWQNKNKTLEVQDKVQDKTQVAAMLAPLLPGLVTILSNHPCALFTLPRPQQNGHFHI